MGGERSVFYKIFIIILILVIIFILYYLLTEMFLITDYTLDGGSDVNVTFFTSPQQILYPTVWMHKEYLFGPRSNIFNPLHNLGGKLYIHKQYYLCFEGIDLPLPLQERKSRDWFIDHGYAYDIGLLTYNQNCTPYLFGKSMIDLQQFDFLVNFPRNSTFYNIKLTEQNSCNNFDKIKAIREYRVEVLNDPYDDADYGCNDGTYSKPLSS